MINLKFSILFINIFLILFPLFPVDYYFAARKNPKTLVFDNKIFVIGGDRGYSGNIKLESDDIWISNYGDTWEKLTKNFVVPSRIDFSCVAFKSKIWLIGGYDQKSHKLLNDIWISGDGKNWEKIVNRAAFSPRIKANLIVYKDKLWLIGGSSNDGEPFSDVWSSDNGYEWVKVSESHEINSIYVSPVVIFKDKIYYFSFGKGIYSTENGIDWKKINDEDKTISDRSFYTVEIFNDLLYVICGQLKSEDQYFTALTNEIWRSDDGVKWTVVSPEFDFLQRGEIYHRFSINPVRKNHSSVLFKNRIFIFGGVTGDKEDTISDAWNTTDGYKWIKIY